MMDRRLVLAEEKAFTVASWSNERYPYPKMVKVSDARCEVHLGKKVGKVRVAPPLEAPTTTTANCLLVDPQVHQSKTLQVIVPGGSTLTLGHPSLRSQHLYIATVDSQGSLLAGFGDGNVWRWGAGERLLDEETSPSGLYRRDIRDFLSLATLNLTPTLILTLILTLTLLYVFHRPSLSGDSQWSYQCPCKGRSQLDYSILRLQGGCMVRRREAMQKDHHTH